MMNEAAVTAALAELGSVASELDALQARIARAASVIRAEAVPPPAPPPTPPAPPPPPPTGPLVKMISSDMQEPVPIVGGTVPGAYAADHYQALFPVGHRLAGYRLSQGPRDTLRLDAVPPPRAWDVFADAATGTLAFPAGGKDVLNWDILPVYGSRALFARPAPVVDRERGRYFHPKLPRGNEGLPVRKLLESGLLPTASGPRGVGIASAYTTWHGHVDWAQDADGNMLVGQRSTNKHVPMFVGITVDGRMCRLSKDGGIYYDAQMPVTPASYFFDFTYFEPARRVQFVADTGAGRILKVTHTPKVPQSFSTEVWMEGMGKITSLRAIGAMLYTIDADTGHVWEIDTSTKAKRMVCTLPLAWWIDYDSQGRLVILDLHMIVHVVDPQSGVVLSAFNAVPPSARLASARGWVQCSVDRAGSCGPDDGVVVCASTGAGNVDVYHWAADGSRQLRLVNWPGRATVGPSSRATEVAHYPWVVAVHPTQALVLLHGFGELAPTVLAASRGLAWAPYDVDSEKAAIQAWTDGGDPEASGVVPSFSAQCSADGWSVGGLLTFDALAEMPPQQAADFLRRGGIGSVPRPISTTTVRHMLRRVRYCSHEHVRQAAAGRGPQWLAEVNGVL